MRRQEKTCVESAKCRGEINVFILFSAEMELKLLNLWAMWRGSECFHYAECNVNVSDLKYFSSPMH